MTPVPSPPDATTHHLCCAPTVGLHQLRLGAAAVGTEQVRASFHPVPKRGQGGTNRRSRENASHSVLNRRTRHVWPVAFWLPPAWQGGISKGGVDSCKLVGMERGSRQASAGMAGAAAVTLDTPAFQQLPAPGQLRLLADGVRRGVNVTQVGWRLAHYCSPVCWR